MAAKRAFHLDNKDDLMYKLTEGSTSGVSYGGYNKELLTQNLSQMEETLIMCSKCLGIMRDACNSGGGMAMGCKTCVSEELCPQPVGKVREMVLQLACKCPLQHRGCEWCGVISELSEHLDQCGQLLEQCPYSNYGCSKVMERENREAHRIEEKEYHTEIVSLFMAKKVKQLEEEKEEHKKVLDKLESIVKYLFEERKYYKLNGIIWNITEREAIRNKFQEFVRKIGTSLDAPTEERFHLMPQYTRFGTQIQYRPQNTPYPFQTNIGSQGLGDDMPILGQWNGNSYNGPQFIIEHTYQLYPELYFYDANSVGLNLAPLPGKAWSLEGMWNVVLVNENDYQDHWSREVKGVKFSSKEKLKLMDIPTEVFLNEKYYHDGVIRLKILFQ